MELETKFMIAFLIVSIMLFVGGYYYSADTREYEIPERNYKAEVLLGITPNMDSRTPMENDIDTKLNLQTSDGSVYRLFESRDFITYGKTFVVKIS